MSAFINYIVNIIILFFSVDVYYMKCKKIFYLLSLILIFSLSSCTPSQWHYRNIPLKRKQIINTATKYIGTPYHHGGSNPSGFDCSGYVYYVYTKNGISIPRSTTMQYKKGKKIPLRVAQPGDLVFFSNQSSGVSHVGIFVGNDTFIHAPSSGKVIRYDLISNPYWKRRFVATVSYLNNYSQLNQREPITSSYSEERFEWK